MKGQKKVSAYTKVVNGKVIPVTPHQQGYNKAKGEQKSMQSSQSTLQPPKDKNGKASISQIAEWLAKQSPERQKEIFTFHDVEGSQKEKIEKSAKKIYSLI